MKESNTQEPVGGMLDKQNISIEFAEWIPSSGFTQIAKRLGGYWFRSNESKKYTTQDVFFKFLIDSGNASECDVYGHDIIPILGYENSIIGECCISCGYKIDDRLAPPSAPIKTEGEDEINLLKETINNQHALILSAEQRGYEKAKEEFSAPPSPDVEALAEKYANGIIPNPNSKDAPYYTTGNVWDEISDAFKAGYSASIPQSSKTFYCWHKEATGEDSCKQQCKDCSGCKGSEEISNIIPQSSNLKEGDFITGDFPYKESKSSTEEEKELVEKLKYVDHVLSDDGYQSESEIRSIVKDVMNYFKRNL